MLDEIQKLLDRHFAIGYVLPAIMFLTGLSVELLISDRYPSQLAQVAGVGDAALFVALYGFVAWFLAVLLLAVNRGVVRFLEGYPGGSSAFGIEIRNPLELLRFRHVRRFKELVRRRDELRHQLSAGDETKGAELAKVTRTLVSLYPSKESLVLPTRFGNVMRAFEEYSSVMYGFDLVPGWYRLMAVVPKEYIEALEEGRSGRDLWINLTVLASVGGTYYGASLAIREGLEVFSTLRPYPVLLVVVLAILAFYDRATSAAMLHGNLYKAAVDVYLPKLYELLEFEEMEDPNDRYSQWQAFSQASIFHSRDHLLIAMLGPEEACDPAAGVAPDANSTH